MRIGFNTLWPLFLLIPALAVIIGIYYKFMRGSDRQRLFTVLRSIFVILIILSLCGPVLIRHAKDTATVFVADLSGSTVTEHTAMAGFIKDAMDVKGEKDHTGVIAFGLDAQVESTVSDQGFFEAFETGINPGFTDIQKALIQANAMFPAGMKKRLVVMTDGRENMGDVSRQLGTLSQGDVAVDFYDMQVSEVVEAQIQAVDVPKQGEKNQIIEVKVSVKSNTKQKASLYLYSKNQLRQEQIVELDVGDNHFVFNDRVEEGGLVPYRAEIVPEKDTFIENNKLSSFIMISDMPKVMVVQDGDEQGQNLISMMEGYAHVTVKNAKEVPLETAALIEYDAFVLADVSYSDLDPKFIENLDEIIRHQGKGLLVTGGDNSYGLGGYQDTLLEEMLPVNMDVKSKEEKPNLGLLLVIDKSGSMSSGQFGISKMELAKEAAIRATEILEEKDQLGVIAFDGSYKWVIETSLVEDRKAMQSQIATLVPGGGTSILPALGEAVNDLKEKDVALKHIILLTDGQAERAGYESTLSLMESEGITLSTVAVGEGADRQLLYYLALNGGGRYYATDVFSDIPSIFTKEAYMAGKKYLNNVSFFPEVYSSSVILSGIEGLPELDGYVATSKKDNARTVLVGPEEDPIMATWQYGLGRTMAWTSDMQGLWSSKWLGWQANQHFWINSMSWLIQEGMNDDYSITSSFEEGMGKISVVSVEQDATVTETMNGTLIAPDGSERQVAIEAVAPGRYEGQFIPEEEGVYLVHIPIGEGEVLATGVNIGYSPEFDILGHDMTTPSALARLSGGRLINEPSIVFEGELPDVKGSFELANLLMTLALLLFIFEIILRKTNLNFEWVTTATDAVKSISSRVSSLELTASDDVKRYDVSGKGGIGGKSGGNRVTGSSDKDDPSEKGSKRRKKERITADTAHIDALMKQKANRKK